MGLTWVFCLSCCLVQGFSPTWPKPRIARIPHTRPRCAKQNTTRNGFELWPREVFLEKVHSRCCRTILSRKDRAFLREIAQAVIDTMVMTAPEWCLSTGRALQT